jgi:hypothetical protein
MAATHTLMVVRERDASAELEALRDGATRQAAEHRRRRFRYGDVDEEKEKAAAQEDEEEGW